MKKKKVAITTSSFGKFDERPLAPLHEDFEVILNPHGRKLKKEETVEVCRSCVGIIAGTEQLGLEVLELLPDLRVISRCGTGLDNVDTAAAKTRGIKVFNTPDAPTRAVSELTVGLALNLLRKINEMDAAVRKGKWEKLMGNLLYGKRIGIVGFGRIGKSAASLLRPFGCEIVFSDPFVEEESSYKKLSLNELLGLADIVVIHVSTKDMIIGAAEMARMKKGSWLINVARGGTVDEEALYEALKSGHLRGAAVDVFGREPYDGKLSQLNNTIVTPHIGSYAVESRIEMEMLSTENLLKGLKNV